MISSLVISSLVDAAGVDEGGVHVIECKEFVPTTLGLMDACNEDDRNSVCAISSQVLQGKTNHNRNFSGNILRFWKGKERKV
jgi:hypothetical protein